MLVLGLGVGFRLVEQNVRTIREGAGQAAVANLAADELFVIRGGSLGIQLEGILTLGSQSRVEPQVVPVTGGNRVFDLG